MLDSSTTFILIRQALQRATHSIAGGFPSKTHSPISTMIDLLFCPIPFVILPRTTSFNFTSRKQENEMTQEPQARCQECSGLYPVFATYASARFASAPLRPLFEDCPPRTCFKLPFSIQIPDP
jgi:hypothetical protein